MLEHTPYENRFVELDLVSLRGKNIKHLRKDLRTVFVYLQGRIKKMEWKCSMVHGRRMRDIRYKLKQDSFQLAIRKSSFTMKTVMKWIRLPGQAGQTPSFEVFMTRSFLPTSFTPCAQDTQQKTLCRRADIIQTLSTTHSTTLPCSLGPQLESCNYFFGKKGIKKWSRTTAR